MTYFIFFSLTETNSIKTVGTSVCLIFPLIVFPLDVFLHGDEQASPRRKSNGAGRKDLPIHYGRLWLPRHLKIHEQSWAFSNSSSLTFVKPGTDLRDRSDLVRMWTHFTHWPWASYLNGAYLRGFYSVNHQMLYCPLLSLKLARLDV